MKVLSVAGYHHTGKTTVTIELIKELRKRGFNVTSIKDIHNENFTMEKKGSNSWKHAQASGDTVIARGITETYQIWNRQLSLNEMLSHLKSDYVVVEGMKDVALPRIVCAEDEKQLKELIDGTVFAISGKYANDHDKYEDLNVFHSKEQIKELTDLVVEKVFHVLPLPKLECCGECGMNCREMVSGILAGRNKREDCKTDRNLDIKIEIAGNDINIVPYVQNTLKDIIKAYVNNLKGYHEGDSIDIKIRE
ncbi:MAG: molybdopterin-guanine dinucleotide biosynthesis protein B [Candidatus Cloacimonetes bacterium]|jgi:molybdopterin-guanine dinucleotide biosynthesis protein B|nr:molybdopterin-guanine dinucleotide biosynthesis protein B [Candidatus Cloacimonadota bacterium]